MTTNEQQRPPDEWFEARAATMERMWVLADQDSNWRPSSSQQMQAVIDGSTPQTEPTVFRRDDGVPLLYPGRINMFLGEPEGCKTWAGLVAITQEIRAGNAGMLIDFEDSLNTAIERLQQLGLTSQQILDGFIYLSPDDAFNEVGQAHIEAAMYMRETHTTLGVAVIDSMTEAMSVNGLDPDSGKDVTKFYHQLPALLANDVGAAVVILDHVTKSVDGRKRWAIGSERKISGLNGAAYSFKPTAPFGRGKTGKINLTVSKDRPGYIRAHTDAKNVIGTLILSSSPDDGSVSVEFAAAPSGGGESPLQDAMNMMADLQEQALQVIRDNPGLPWTELKPLLPGRSEGKTGLRDDLLKAGKIKIEPDGRKKCHFIS